MVISWDLTMKNGGLIDLTNKNGDFLMGFVYIMWLKQCHSYQP